MQVARVPVLSDNYAWLVHDPASGETAAIDPGEAAPVLAAAGQRGWRLSQLWITHWHADHTGGIAGVRAVADVRVTAPRDEADKVPGADTYVADGDRLALGAHAAEVIAVPGHTLGHLAFHFADARLLFTGDLLFAMGCGRLLEGTAAQMYDSLHRFDALPDHTQVFAGHEYTQANARFAVATDPGDAAVAARAARIDRLRAADEATLPTTLAEERATNPFLRAADVDEFARLRTAKDHFRG